MTSDNSLADQVKTLQGYMGRFAKTMKDLTERVNNLENNKKSDDDEREIKEILESQRVIDEILVANTDAIKRINKELLEVEGKIKKQKLEEVESIKSPIEIIGNVVKQGMKRKCRYNNRGHCRYRDRCKYYHSENICKTYLEYQKCDDKSCSDRHPKVCKYWLKSRAGCLRKTSCDYIHVTLGQNEEQVKALDNEEAVEFKCVGCGNCWNDRRCVVKHEIKNHVVYFCLNCDDWVKVKSKVLDENWTLFDEKGNLRHDV